MLKVIHIVIRLLHVNFLWRSEASDAENCG